MKTVKDIQNKARINKWYYWVPVVGTIIYSLIFEFYMNEGVDKKLKRVVKFYRSIFNLISIAIAIVFLVLFFVLRNNNGYGPYPWFFWLGLAIGLSQNISVIWPWFLYSCGIKRYLKTIKLA